jgi:hypothetical protein
MAWPMLMHVSTEQEIAQALQSDVSNVYFAAQAVCMRAEAKLADTNHLGAVADGRLALNLAESARARGGRAPPLAERPHLVLAQSSRALGLFQEALGNLTLAQARAPAHRAAELQALVHAVRRDIDWSQGEDLRRAGFAGFRSRFGGSKGGGDEPHSRRTHAAFAGAGRGGRWEYSDWTKAQWDEEYRAAYRRFSKDSERFGFGPKAHDAFPWEHGQSTTQQPPPDPFAPPFGKAAGASRGHSCASDPPPRPGDARAGSGGKGAASIGLYSLLQVPVTATATEIKKAYMKLVGSAPRCPCPCPWIHLAPDSVASWLAGPQAAPGQV